jgi:inner membrane protein
MDPLTHVLAGAALGALFAPRGYTRHAAAAGAVVAALPDLDVLIGSEFDPLLSVEMHRHFSHALVFAPVLAALVAALATRLFKVPFMSWWWRLIPAAVSAGLLDACTSYGTELLWPFAHERVALAVIAVVDPLFTVILACTLVFALLNERPALAGLGLALAGCYLMVGTMQQSRGEWALRSLAHDRGHVVEQLVVKPTLGNLLVWRGVYRAKGRIYADAIRLGLGSGLMLYPGLNASHVTTNASALPENSVLANDARRFARLSDGFLVRHPSKPMLVGDARFSMSPDGITPMFAITIDANKPDAHAPYHELREWDAGAWERFKAMLQGASLPRLQSLKRETLL